MHTCEVEIERITNDQAMAIEICSQQKELWKNIQMWVKKRCFAQFYLRKSYHRRSSLPSHKQTFGSNVFYVHDMLMKCGHQIKCLPNFKYKYFVEVMHKAFE